MRKLRKDDTEVIVIKPSTDIILIFTNKVSVTLKKENKHIEISIRDISSEIFNILAVTPTSAKKTLEVVVNVLLNTDENADMVAFELEGLL